MRVLEINSVNHGSTGSIMRNIALEVEKMGAEIYTSCQLAKSTQGEIYNKHIYIGNRIDRNIHLALGKINGKYGIYSNQVTKKFIKQIDELSPDIIHLHNLHKGYINVGMLFKYIKEKNIPIVWTLHDCWSFTGQCPNFDQVVCDRWKIGCGKCPQYKEYPSYIDRTAFMFAKKKQWFRYVRNMTIVTPSQWLADLVKESFLSDYDSRVINNGINLDVFRPRESSLRNKYHLEDKTVILGVASVWNSRKGLEEFINLHYKLNKEYTIILIGLNREQIRNLPNNMIGISKTENMVKLAEYYSMADVFLNLSREDNFPTVNIEALACGTPVVTLPTGGSPESIDDGCGMIVTQDLIVATLNNLKKYDFDSRKCVEASKKYSAVDKFKEYGQLYIERLYNNLY